MFEILKSNIHLINDIIKKSFILLLIFIFNNQLNFESLKIIIVLILCIFFYNITINKIKIIKKKSIKFSLYNIIIPILFLIIYNKEFNFNKLIIFIILNLILFNLFVFNNKYFNNILNNIVKIFSLILIIYFILDGFKFNYIMIIIIGFIFYNNLITKLSNNLIKEEYFIK